VMAPSVSLDSAGARGSRAVILNPESEKFAI
jgi:hypothetical protein